MGAKPREDRQMLYLAKELVDASDYEFKTELQEALDDLVKIQNAKLLSNHTGLRDKESVIQRKETILANLTTEPTSARRLLDKLIAQDITIYTIQSVQQVLAWLARTGEIDRIKRHNAYCYFLKGAPPQNENPD